MSEKTVTIEVVWRNHGFPITSAQTGEVEVAAVVQSKDGGKPRLVILKYLDNGTWLDPYADQYDGDFEEENIIVAWSNMEAVEIIFKMGLKDWQVTAEKALEKHTENWRCDKCGKEGMIEYDNNHSDVWSVFSLIILSHKATSPECNAQEDEIISLGKENA